MKKLINEINRIKELSNINESSNIDENTFLEKLSSMIKSINPKISDSIDDILDSLMSKVSHEDDVISGSYSAKGQRRVYDALHSFQSRVSDGFGGKMNTLVKEGIKKYKEDNNIDAVDIKDVKVDINPDTLTVDWEVSIGPSTDGYTYEEFDSRGSAGGGERAVDKQLSNMNSYHSGTPKLVKHYNEDIPVCYNSDGTKKPNGCKGKINIQQKFFKFGKKI
jgi:hypothetical protein